jgi:hypothetical protein
MMFSPTTQRACQLGDMGRQKKLLLLSLSYAASLRRTLMEPLFLWTAAKVGIFN